MASQYSLDLLPELGSNYLENGHWRIDENLGCLSSTLRESNVAMEIPPFSH